MTVFRKIISHMTNNQLLAMSTTASDQLNREQLLALIELEISAASKRKGEVSHRAFSRKLCDAIVAMVAAEVRRRT
jgi:hypothetical protein